MKEIIYKKGLIEMKIKQALASKSLGQSSYILILLTVFSMTLFLVSLTLNLPGFMGIKAASADSLNLTGNWSTEAQVVSGPYLGSGFSGSMILSQSGTNLTGTFSSSQYSGACSGTYSNGTMSLLGVTTIGYSLQVTATVTGTGQQIQGTWTDNLGDSGIYSASKVATSGSGTGAVAKIQAFWQWDTDFIQEPVDSATGAHQLERALLTCHGVQDLDFKIQYNSLLLNKDALGNGWSHNYEAYLDILNGGGGIRIHWNANYSNWQWPIHVHRSPDRIRPAGQKCQRLLYPDPQRPERLPVQLLRPVDQDSERTWPGVGPDLQFIKQIKKHNGAGFRTSLQHQLQ
jgi:hypothetical protein